MNKARLIEALAGTERPRRMIVDKQSDRDIINLVCRAHRQNVSDYDRIAHYFDRGSVYDICERLWIFCRRNLPYEIESKEVQNVGNPWAILVDYPTVDCKNYASFIAGVLDALKRQGMHIIWEFRFISDRLFSLADRRADHVFVVVNPATQDIWVDPVLERFNQHIYYFYRASRRIRTDGIGNRRIGAIGGIGCCNGDQVGLTSVESSLLADVKAYADGLSGAMNQTLTTSTFNVITEAILTGVATAVFGPVALVALAALKAGAVALDKAFGVGSASARIVTDLSNLNLSGLMNDVFGGRIYETDQYWAGVYYQFYVLGNNVTDTNHVADSMVLPALKWFVDRSGVYISGREHIIGLTQGPMAYENYHSVNPDTTTDMTLVRAASVVARKYWQQPGNFSPALKGSWANTIGVYDQALINLAASYGETPEQYTSAHGTQDVNAQLTLTAAQSPALAFLQSQSIVTGLPNWLILAGAGGIIIFALTSNKK